MEMSLTEIYNYTDGLKGWLQSQDFNSHQFGSIYREWQRWENLSRVLRTQFYGEPKPGKVFIDKSFINKINFKYVNKL